MNACPYKPPPAGGIPWPATQPVSAAILSWAHDNLKYPMGTIIQGVAGNQQVMARLECHYHPPGGAVKPWGPHKGCTIYWPTSSVSPRVIYPPAGEEDLTPIVGTDPCIQAGDSYLGCNGPGTNWSLVAVSGAAALGVTALFVLALKHAGKAARRSKR